MIANSKLNNQMPVLMVLFRQYVTLINQGDIDIASVSDYMVKTVNSSAVSEALLIFKNHFQNLGLPVNNIRLNSEHIKVRDKAISTFMNKVMDLEQNTEYHVDLQNKMETLFLKYVDKNDKSSYKNTTSTLIETFASMQNVLK